MPGTEEKFNMLLMKITHFCCIIKRYSFSGMVEAAMHLARCLPYSERPRKRLLSTRVSRTSFPCA
jgi:hypothetical protein